MPQVVWKSKEEKEYEWGFAKQRLTLNGKLLPNGTKLSRLDYPRDLQHSFMIIDNKIIAISGKGIYLGEGFYGQTKLAEDEKGNLIALKIVRNNEYNTKLDNEAQIANDLGVSGQHVIQYIGLKPYKHYIAYQYLGITLNKYLNINPELSLDKRFHLCLKLSIALYQLHTGKTSKSKIKYNHNDIHLNNIVVDEHDEPHFIDYGYASLLQKETIDIPDLLQLFYLPKETRTETDRWILEKENYKTLCKQLNYNPELRENTRPLLFTFALNTSQQIPTALDVAEALIIDWLQLDINQKILAKLSPDKRFETVQILNSVSGMISTLCTKLYGLLDQDSHLIKHTKNFLFYRLMYIPEAKWVDSIEVLTKNISPQDARALHRSIYDIEQEMDKARETLKIKKSCNDQEEPGVHNVSRFNFFPEAQPPEKKIRTDLEAANILYQLGEI